MTCEGRAALRPALMRSRSISAAELIAAYMAAGESEISRTHLKLSGRRRPSASIGARQAQRLMRYLKARGHIERYGDRELIRPVAVQAGELPFASQPKHGVLAVTVAWAAN